jgi:hypothetical protein
MLITNKALPITNHREINVKALFCPMFLNFRKAVSWFAHSQASSARLSGKGITKMKISMDH